MITVYLPKNVKFILLNNSYLYIFNSSIFLLINLKNSNFFFNTSLNILKLKLFHSSKTMIGSNKLNNFIFLWDNFIFSKIYFLGKGFKLKKTNKNIFFNFNYSHIMLFIFQKLLVKKIQKHKLLLFTKNKSSLMKLLNIILNIKSLNVYTKRGIRLAKQIVYIKKKNK